MASLAAIRGDKTMAVFASKFAVHASHVTALTKQVLERAADPFKDDRRKRWD